MRKTEADMDNDLDQTAGVFKALYGAPHGHSDALAASPSTRRPPTSYQLRQKLSKTSRKPGPDTSTGLALYFLDKCPPLSWETGFEMSNFRGIIGVFSELKRCGYKADICRSMVDVYFIRLEGRNPRRPYVWDFKGKRHELLQTVALDVELPETEGACESDADKFPWEI